METGTTSGTSGTSGKLQLEERASQTRPRYRPIAQYAAIGDCRTAALVAPDGSIDWCCMPHFDSPAIFLRILDADKGGYFQVCPPDVTATTVAYLDDSNVLESTYVTPTGRLRLVDAMPVRPRPHRGTLARALTTLGRGVHRDPALEREAGNDVAAAHRLNRVATCLSGEVDLDVTIKATFDYALYPAEVALQPVGSCAACAILSGNGQYLVFLVRYLASAVISPRQAPTLHVENGDVRTRVHLRAGQRIVAALNYARNAAEADALLGGLVGHDFDVDLDETLDYWRSWSSRCRYHGPYHESVTRSALALKLCTFEPTGAIVAAPTTSLPERIGGVRNWDYRYTWLRDSAFTLGALESLGYRDEARDYFHFLDDLRLRSGTDLHVLYSILGLSGVHLEERTLDYLEGYRGSRPVRIGNGAATQHQMDVYGELLDAAYSYVVSDGFRSPIRVREVNRDLRELSIMVADYVAEHWQDLDHGIWEVRGPKRAFVYSRAMCWVAMHRASTLAFHHGHMRHLARWSAVAKRIREDVLAHGYNAELGTFTQAYGDRTLDAANLRLPLCDFIPATDPRMSSTIRVTQAGLSGPNGFLYRYRPVEAEDTLGVPDQLKSTLPALGRANDGLPGSEGTFLACTFWLVSDLCHLGEVEEARAIFERLCAHSSSLGLFSEELDPATGAMLGNYPQAFTHIGLINAAVALQQAVEGRLTTQSPPTHQGQ